MTSDGSSWLRALRAQSEAAEGAPEGAPEQEELLAMRSFVARSLSKGFGRQLAAEDVEDLVQEIMLKVHTKHSSFRHESRFSTWVGAIAVNVALAELRRRRHVLVELDDALRKGTAAIVEPSGPSSIQSAQRNDLLRRAIDDALTDRQREAILGKLGGLPMGELAARLESSSGALYKLLHDARKRLRTYLEAQGLRSQDLLVESVEVRA